MTYTYRGITADSALWQALDMIEDQRVPFSERPLRGKLAPSDADLIEARIAGQSTGDEALVWLIQERRRQWAAIGAQRTEDKRADEALHIARINRQAAEMNLEAAKLQRGVAAR